MLDLEISPKKIIPFAALGVGIIAVLVAITGFDEIINAISMADKQIYAIAFLVQVTAILVWLFKWRTLTRAINITVKTRRMFPILLSGIFINTAVPSAKVGGEPLRGYMFSKIGDVPIEKSFSSIAADRALDGIPFIFIVIVSLTLLIIRGALSIYMIILLIIAAAFMGVVIVSFLYVCLKPEPAKNIVQWFIRRLRRIISKFRPIEYVQEKAEEFLEDFGEGAQAIFRSRRHSVSALMMSFCYWSLAILRMYLVFLALGQPVDFPTIGIAVTLGLLLQAVPIPGGLGIVESAYVLIFQQSAGIAPDVAMAAALLDRGISFWFTSLFSGAGIAWSSLELSKIVED